MPDVGSLQARHESARAQFVDIDGVRVPATFGDVAGEYAALRESAGLVDLSFRAKLRFTGRARVRFLHNLLTNDIEALRPGHGCNALKLSVQGKMQAALRVLCLEDELCCDLEPQPLAGLVAELRKRIILEDAALEDESRAWALLSLQGPRAGDVIADALDTDLPSEMHGHLLAHIGGVVVRIARSDHTGEAGYDVWVPPADATIVWDALLSRSADVRRVGLAALDLRRIEAGIPWHGREITPEHFPQEAGLDDGWISYTKGCYLGQETIARIHHVGHVNRNLCALVLAPAAAAASARAGEAPELPGSSVRIGEKAVGEVTSAAHSFRLGRSVALAYVRREVAVPGTPVHVLVGATTRNAEVAALPLA